MIEGRNNNNKLHFSGDGSVHLVCGTARHSSESLIDAENHCVANRKSRIDYWQEARIQMMCFPHKHTPTLVSFVKRTEDLPRQPKGGDVDHKHYCSLISCTISTAFVAEYNKRPWRKMLIRRIYLHELLQANDGKSMLQKITSKKCTRVVCLALAGIIDTSLKEYRRRLGNNKCSSGTALQRKLNCRFIGVSWL